VNGRRSSASSIPQHESDGNHGLHLSGFAVQRVWPVAPLTHSIDGGWREQWVTADQLQAKDGAVTADDCVQHHVTLSVDLHRE